MQFARFSFTPPFSAVFAIPKSSQKPFKRFPGLVTLEITGLKPRCE